MEPTDAFYIDPEPIDVLDSLRLNAGQGEFSPERIAYLRMVDARLYDKLVRFALPYRGGRRMRSFIQVWDGVTARTVSRRLKIVHNESGMEHFKEIEAFILQMHMTDVLEAQKRVILRQFQPAKPMRVNSTARASSVSTRR